MRSPVLLLASLVFAGSLAAQSLTGHIQDFNGLPLNNVAVILSNGAPLGTTDISGNFTIAGLRNRTYTVQLDPHNNFLAPQQFDFTVNGAANLGTVIMQPGVPVSGQWLGPTGAALLGVNMNAYLPGNIKLFTPHDGSDALGNVTIAIPINTEVILRAVPPVGSNLVPFQTTVNLSASLNLGTRTMAQGLLVTGSVVDDVNGLGINACEFVTTDMLTGLEVLQLNKLSSATGAFTLLVPFGLYQIDVIPPLTAPLRAGRSIIGQPVLGNLSLGLVRLKQGALLSGTVTGPGGVPVGGADIDVYTTTEDKLYTPNDNTAASGLFSVVVPFGAGVSYSVRVDPQPASGLVGLRTASIAFAGATNLGVLSLVQGVPLSLTVVDGVGAPIAGANLNLSDPVTGAEIITPGDVTDATGLMTATVPIGTWNVHLQAPQGGAWQPLSLAGVPIGGPITTSVALATKSLAIDAHGLGILAVPQGSEVFLQFNYFNLTPATILTFLEAVIRTPDGVEYPWVAPILFGFPGLAGGGAELWIPTPVLPISARDRVLRGVVRARDLNGNLLDEAYVQFFSLP